jgi:LuxR family maltose regulon positive regulatory protein
VRIFVDEGPAMAALLRTIVRGRQRNQPGGRSPAARDNANRIPQAFRPQTDVATPAPVPGLINRLTSREVEVLDLIAAGQRNQEIAAELFLTPDTVKRHVSHICTKLGVSGRTAALARARELNLIP